MKNMGKIAPAVGLLWVLGLSPAFAQQTLSAQLTFGSAATGTLIKKTGGGELDFGSSGTGALGVKVSSDLSAPEGGQSGFRYGLEGGASWHDLEATKTDVDLGLVTVKNSWLGRFTVGSDMILACSFPT